MLMKEEMSSRAFAGIPPPTPCRSIVLAVTACLLPVPVGARAGPPGAAMEKVRLAHTRLLNHRRRPFQTSRVADQRSCWDQPPAEAGHRRRPLRATASAPGCCPVSLRWRPRPRPSQLRLAPRKKTLCLSALGEKKQQSPKSTKSTLKKNSNRPKLENPF